MRRKENKNRERIDINFSFDYFEHFLLIQEVELELFIPEIFSQISCDYFLNPRYLRGSDFLMRWSQGRWAEELVQSAFEKEDTFRVVPYGPSSVAPTEPEKLESYFEMLRNVNIVGKRPDFLILHKRSYEQIQDDLNRIQLSNIPFTSDDQLEFLISKAIAAAEVETSLWVASEMPDYGKGKPLQNDPTIVTFKKRQKAPTIIIKEEDIEPLKEWQKYHKIPVYIFHLFYDLAYFLSFSRALELIRRKIVVPTRQTFQAPGGPTTTKNIYKFWYTLARPLGKMVKPPSLVAKHIKDKNGHILPYVHFENGELELSHEIIEELKGVMHESNPEKA
jgi:hypothetical protein